MTPASATAIENTQARMRPVSPILSQSDTAPMAQKLVLLVTAPMMAAMMNTAPSTSVWIVNCTGQRRQVAGFRGSNSAPAWSPSAWGIRRVPASVSE